MRKPCFTFKWFYRTTFWAYWSNKDIWVIQVIIYFVVTVKRSLVLRIWVDKLVECKLGCVDLKLTSYFQAPPGVGLLLVLVAFKIIYCAFAEGYKITCLRSSTSSRCASLTKEDLPASRSHKSLDPGWCLRLHIIHINRIRLFTTNYAFSYSTLGTANKCLQVTKSRNSHWRKESLWSKDYHPGFSFWALCPNC